MSEFEDIEIVSVLARAGIVVDGVLSRLPNPKASSSTSEIVTLQLAGGRTLRVLFKNPPARAPGVEGHWRGLEYEARVYADVLSSLGATTAGYLGVARERSGSPVLLLECVGGEDGSSVGLRSDGVPEAAAWLGAFHRRAAALVGQEDVDFIQRFDAEYLGAWATRTLAYVGARQDVPVWLTRLVTAYGESVGELASARPTVIHGEYYHENILAHGTRIVPVDWESAAVGAGEIDLAALTEGWGDDVAALAEQAYSDARWPDEKPGDLAEALWLARLYLHFRWLGDRPGALESGDGRWRLGELRRMAETLFPAGQPTRAAR